MPKTKKRITKSDEPVNTDELLEFIDQSLADNCRPKMFLSTLCKRKKQKTSLRSLFRAIHNALSEMRVRRIGKRVAFGSCQMYDALSYKFGPSNRHQKYWRSTMQTYRELKRINGRNLLEPFETLATKLETSDFCYKPTRGFISFLGAILLERIYRLDRMRHHCARSASLSMGYVEICHLLTFNLMSIAIASDIAKEAIAHIRGLISVYNSLSPWFRRASKRFPKLFSQSSLYSAHQIEEEEIDRGSQRRLARKPSILRDIHEIERLLKLNEMSRQQK